MWAEYFAPCLVHCRHQTNGSRRCLFIAWWWCSVSKSCLTLCDPKDCSTPSSSVLHYLSELAKFMSTESVMLSNHLILCRPLLLLPSIFPIIRIFSSDLALRIRWPKYWSFSISPSNEMQGWFPLGLTDLISLQSKGLSRVFSSTTIPNGRHHKDT